MICGGWSCTTSTTTAFSTTYANIVSSNPMSTTMSAIKQLLINLSSAVDKMPIWRSIDTRFHDLYVANGDETRRLIAQGQYVMTDSSVLSDRTQRVFQAYNASLCSPIIYVSYNTTETVKTLTRGTYENIYFSDWTFVEIWVVTDVSGMACKCNPVTIATWEMGSSSYDPNNEYLKIDYYAGGWHWVRLKRTADNKISIVSDTIGSIGIRAFYANPLNQYYT